MKLFSTIGSRRIPGHKNISVCRKVQTLPPESVSHVYFPLVAGNGATCDPIVKIGDKVKVGTKIAYREAMSVPLFSSVSGTVTEIKKLVNITNGRPCDHIVIENDFKNTPEKLLTPVKLDAPREHLIEAIKEAGILGMGGAGFPTWFKYHTAKDIHTVLINAVECEPYLTTDYCAMRDSASDIVSGARYLVRAAGADKAIIALKKGRVEAYEALVAASEEHPEVTIQLVPDKYPMGWEGTLIYEVFKARYDKLPSEVGVVVNNAQTAVAVHKALAKGEVITSRLITVSGNAVVNPGNIVVPIGTLAEDVLKQFEIRKDLEYYLLPGGPMTSKSARNATFALQVVHGGLTLLEKVKFRTVPCLRCGDCTTNCPVGLQPVEIKLAFEARDMVRLAKLETARCVDCGLCSYVCPSKIEVSDIVSKAKTLLRVMPPAGK
ncbi:MAG TPA: RnfABCDGE type electron transport complex subunit C [Bacilli bacterium]|nr:RnfABCDGE type electron transport complex subunit C [Bacilli bacterium]